MLSFMAVRVFLNCCICGLVPEHNRTLLFISGLYLALTSFQNVFFSVCGGRGFFYCHQLMLTNLGRALCSDSRITCDILKKRGMNYPSNCYSIYLTNPVSTSIVIFVSDEQQSYIFFFF